MPVSLQEVLSYRRTLVAVLLIVSALSLLQIHAGTALFVDRLSSSRPFASSSLVPDVTGTHPRLASIDKPDITTNNDSPTLDIVVSMYKEDAQQSAQLLEEIRALEPFNSLDIRTFIYTKDSGANVDDLKEIFNTPLVTKLPNVGREADTYFTHVLDHYTNLARHTMFMQAEMHSPDGAKNRIEGWFQSDTGVLSLGQIESCDCVSCRDAWDDERTFPRIGELYSALNGEFCPQKIALTYQGQIIVSAERIRSKTWGTYKYLKSLLDSDQDNFIHTDPRQPFFEDEPSNPFFGHTIERGYMVLWDCANEEIAEKCGGIAALHTPRPEGLPDDFCQCLDLPA